MQKLGKLEKLLFYLFIFSIPLQTRKVLFFPDKFIEWNSGFLYFTDLLLISLLILWIRRLILEKSKFLQKSDLLLLGFLAIAALSLITSQNIGLSIYQLIKLVEFILLFLYIKNNLDFFNLRKALWLFVTSGFFQSIIAIGQFFSQSSLGLKHFEAGTYNANIPGVATFFVNGVKFIRAYGTAPHPNVLGVFIFFSIFCLYFLSLTRMTRIGMRMMQIVALFILILGLFLTFSRAVIIVFALTSFCLFVVVWFRKFFERKKICGLFILVVVFCSLFVILFWPEFQARFSAISPEDQAVSLRVYYNDIALSSIKEKPFLGLGLGNFVWYLLNNYHFKEFWLYQPVHNLYLLIASEMGIFGLIVFLIFVVRILLGSFNLFFKRQILDNKRLVLLVFYSLFFAFLVLSFIDHYFWTIQQSRLIFWIVLGIASGLSLSGPHSLTDKTSPSGGED